MSEKLILGIENLVSCFKYIVASIMSSPFVFKMVRWVCYVLYMSVFLSKWMKLSSFSVTSPSVMAFWTMSWIKSSRPNTLTKKTFVKFVLGFSGNIPVPFRDIFTFLSFMDCKILFHFGRSASEWSLKTIIVACRVFKGTNASRSLSSMTVLITFSKDSLQASTKGIWMKCVNPFSLRGGLDFPLTSGTTSSWIFSLTSSFF